MNAEPALPNEALNLFQANITSVALLKRRMRRISTCSNGKDHRAENRKVFIIERTIYEYVF